MPDSLIADQLNLSPQLLTQLEQNGFDSVAKLAQRSRGEIFVVLGLHNDHGLTQIESALSHRGLQLREPQGPLIVDSVGQQNPPGPWAAKILTNRHRLVTLEELDHLGPQKIKELKSIGKPSFAIISLVMRVHRYTGWPYLPNQLP